MKSTNSKHFFALLILLCISYCISAQSPWANVSTGLPTSGTETYFQSFSESGSNLFIASLDGGIYYNNFSTGLSQSWTNISVPPTFQTPLTNICAVGSYLYMWGGTSTSGYGASLYMYNMSTSTWTTIFNSTFSPQPATPSYLSFYNQLLATDGTNLYFVDLISGGGSYGNIYKTPVGSTTAVTSSFYTTIYTINAFFVYPNQNKMYIGTSSGLYSASTSATGSTWSDEFAGTSFEGIPVYQFTNTNYYSAYPSGTFTACMRPVSTLYDYYPFSVVAKSGTTLKVVQLVEARYENQSIGTGCFTCQPGYSCTKATWESSFDYVDNSWPSGLPTNPSFGSFITSSGGTIPSGDGGTNGKQWAIGYSGTTGSEKSQTFNLSSSWATGTEGVSGLPAFSSATYLNAGYGAQNTYDGYSGMVFLSINNGIYGQIYALQSYTYDKTNANNPNVPQSQINMLDNSLKLFPNPASNMITFDLSQLQSTDFTLKIYDELGREKEVPASNAYMDMGVEKLDVDISKFTTGVYFYKLNADQEYSGRFVKQ